MQLGLAIGIFIIVAIFITSLFCLITRYFNRRLRKALQQQAELYSLVEGVEGQRQDINEGQYEDFVHKRIEEFKKKKKNQENKYPYQVEMTDINHPLKIYQEDIYGIPQLKKNPALPPSVPLMQQTTRSLISSKTFKPQNFNIQSRRSNLSMKSIQPDFKKNKPVVITHKFVNKIVCYSQEGLKIMEINVTEVSKVKENGPIRQRKGARKAVIKPSQKAFDQALQAYGFEKNIYEAFKFITTLQIVNMKPGEIYQTKSLKKTQQKVSMQFPSFFHMSNNIQAFIESKDKQNQLHQIQKQKESKLQKQNIINQILNGLLSQKQKEKQAQRIKLEKIQKQKQKQMQKQRQKEQFQKKKLEQSDIKKNIDSEDKQGINKNQNLVKQAENKNDKQQPKKSKNYDKQSKNKRPYNKQFVLLDDDQSLNKSNFLKDQVSVGVEKQLIQNFLDLLKQQ